MPGPYYVGAGGNDANNGTTWALRKLTLNGAEDIPVAAGDIVYVGPGVYRETLTCDVSGGVGSPIVYVGDVLGEHTDGIGGPVRITGSDDDQTAARNNCIAGANRNYRTFRGFWMDTCNSYVLTGGASTGTNWIVEDCCFQHGANLATIHLTGANQLNWIIRRVRIKRGYTGTLSHCILFNQAATLDNAGHIIENCVLEGGYSGVLFARVGGVTVRNTSCLHNQYGIRVGTALAAGQTETVNNCIIAGSVLAALGATALGEITEDYNNLYANNVNYSNVGAGAHTTTYPVLLDLGLLHAGASQVSGFHLPQPRAGTLSQWSLMRAVADTGAATEDISGVSRPVTAGKRSWGAVQYEPVARQATTVHGGSASLELSDAGRYQFKIPVTAVATTINVAVYREANYAGNNPCMIIKQAGQADRTTVDGGAAGVWNHLTDTWNPVATPGWITVELVSQNTDAANPATNDVFFDDLTVSVNTSLGTMETWLWDQNVADWVEHVATCDYPAVGDVEAGVAYNFGASVGTFAVPAVGDVEVGTNYGAGGVEFAGTFVVPVAGDVEVGVNYGALGVEFAGAFVVPAIGDVRLGTGYGNLGVEFVGTMAGGAGAYPIFGGLIVGPP